MQFKYVNKIENGVATMLCYGEIGRQVNGDLFAYELNWLAHSGDYKKIHLRINTNGGDIVQGMSIYSAVRNSPIPVETFIDYLAASMGGPIALSGSKVHMAKNGLIMLHNPLRADGSQDQKTINALTYLKESLVEIFTAKTGLMVDAVSEMMNKETWLNSKEATEMKMVDSVFTPMVSRSATKTELKNCAFVNSISQEILQKMEGTPLEIETLKSQVDKYKNSVSDKDTEIATLKKENEDLKKQIEAQADKEATEYVDSLVMSGKLKKEQRDGVLISAKKDLSLVKNVYESVTVPAANRFTNIVGTGEKKEAREDWSYSDWEKKDPKGLQEMYKNDSEKYNSLLSEWKQTRTK